ncbi:WbqC family protein [Umezawaea sp. NPDC059074]|uniref:WbqC family protein n=1 Tax=Umezawaea sp. NPDC059074 TaxID=3346716 RepID=UPI0036ADF767
MAANGTVCAIHQPNFFPRLGTIAKIYAADIWVVLDDVQFAARDYQHRTRVAMPEPWGCPRWLTLPVHRPSGRPTLIREVLLCEGDRSALRVERLLRQHYRRGAHWSVVDQVLGEVVPLIHDGARLADIAETTTRAVLDLVGWRGVIVRSSAFDASTERSARLADLTRAVQATTYLCGPSGAGYLNREVFASRGLDVRYFKRVVSSTADVARNLGIVHWLAGAGPKVVGDMIAAAKDLALRG